MAGRVATVARRSAIGAVGLFAAIQLVPYGWRHSNPPVTDEAPWPTAEARQLAVRACYDCHSNETDWPVYSYVAPMSWLVRQDVEAGREELNFSEWGDSDKDAGDAADVVGNSMPPDRYTRLHPTARLSDEEQGQLVQALLAMDEGEEDDEDDDDGGEEGDGNSGLG